MNDRSAQDAAAHYALGKEVDRLDGPIGTVEFLRSTEIVRRALPGAPATVADIGGGPGRYALWLAGAGYEVVHRDLVPLHVEQLHAAAPGPRITSGVADARALDLADACVDAVLLLGPLYHLYERADRLLALAEAHRIARPGAPVFVSAISRWAPRLDGYLVKRVQDQLPGFAERLPQTETDGRLLPAAEGVFGAYCHRPGELRDELETAGLHVTDIVSVEGLAFALPDLAERLGDPAGLEVVLQAARAVERVPELLGLGPHLIATATRPGRRPARCGERPGVRGPVTRPFRADPYLAPS